MTIVENAEMELPEGWAKCQVGDLSSISSGKFLSRGEYDQDANRQFPVGGAGGPIGWTDNANVLGRVMTLGRVGACGFLSIYANGVWATDNTLVIQPAIPDLFDTLRLFFATVVWSELQSGSSQPLITQTLVKAVEISLPPLVEQKRIVAKVDELLARVNAARARLAKVPALLKRFRQSVLAAACSGQLTADWRDGNPSAQKASELIAMILDDRNRRLLDMQTPNSGGRSSTRLPHNLQRQRVDVSQLEPLPDTWEWVSWDDLAEWITYGFTRPMPHVPKGVPIITAKNVRDGHIETEELEHTTKQAFAELSEKDKPRRGEILITKDGAIRGRAAVVETDEPFCISQAVAVVRFGHSMTLPKYLLRVIQAPMTQHLIEEESSGSAIPHISITDFGQFPVPLPPLAEQHEIVRRVEALFALADKIEARVQAATARVEKITQSLLAKAFRGELVPTEAALARAENRPYEPASQLLARLRAQREAQPSATPHSKRRICKPSTRP